MSEHVVKRSAQGLAGHKDSINVRRQSVPWGWKLLEEAASSKWRTGWKNIPVERNSESGEVMATMSASLLGKWRAGSLEDREWARGQVQGVDDGGSGTFSREEACSQLCFRPLPGRGGTHRGRGREWTEGLLCLPKKAAWWGGAGEERMQEKAGRWPRPPCG